MAAFGPPLGYPAAPSKRRPKFVQPLGSTSGFDPQARADGHGIASMRSRAEALGGKLMVESANGSGTRLEVRIPN
jgi:glucose-6-phosphate-specific signal transduction histidine kinase